MNYKQCISLPVMEVDSFVTSSSDTGQLSLLSGMPMPAKSSESGPPTDGFQACTCGREMSDCLIHPSTRDKWIASMRGFLALMFQQPENKQALALKRAVASTVKSYASLASFDLNTCSWKTSQTSFLMDSEQFSGTWPRSGILRNGRVYELPTLGPLTNATAGGFWPTPTSHNAKEGAYPAEFTRNTVTLAAQVGGKLNPQWTEWLMGFPINHTALKVSETDKFPCKPQRRGKSL